MEGWFPFFLNSNFFRKLRLLVIWKEYEDNQILGTTAQEDHMESRVTNSKLLEVIWKVE